MNKNQVHLEYFSLAIYKRFTDVHMSSSTGNMKMPENDQHYKAGSLLSKRQKVY